jgi:hypothetical protein
MVMNIKKSSKGMSYEERSGTTSKSLIFSLAQLGNEGISQENIFSVYTAADEIKGDLLALVSVAVSKGNPNKEELFTEISDQINMLLKHFINEATSIKNKYEGKK